MMRHQSTSRRQGRTRAVMMGAVLVALVGIVAGMFAFSGWTGDSATVRVGSKSFTESVILAEIAGQLIEQDGAQVEHKRQLGGTQILYGALRDGRIDLYPEYTGTIAQEILGGRAADAKAMREMLQADGIGMTASLGFNNTYAVGMRDDVAERLGISTISDLQKHPDLKLGFSNEFMDRKDGWPALRQRYELPQANVTGLDHDLAYRALQSGDIDAIDLYSTDAEITYYKLRVLEDDRKLFPEYRAVYLYRLNGPPEVAGVARSLQNAIDEPTMIGLNAKAKLERVAEAKVASDFIAARFAIATHADGPTIWQRLWQRTAEHLLMVACSLSAAVLLAIPLGVIAANQPVVGKAILGSVAAIYTIPSLALLVFMIPLLGIGFWPAVVALFLYSLLPIVRNTYAGLTAIPQGMRESAEALGLPVWPRLWRIELPMALPSIMAGIQTSAVINVGTATLGALVGAGGYGQPILTGIRLDDVQLILLGAIPAAAMALAAQGAFELLERLIVPRGLRLR